MNAAAFEFALMIEAHSGKGGEQCAVGGETVVREDYGAALLVVIFHEASEIALAFREAHKAFADLPDVVCRGRRHREFCRKSRKILSREALFGAPVGLGEENEVGNGGVGFGPEFFFGLRRVAEEVTPVGVEDVVELEHGHVAADAVAVGGDGAEVCSVARRGARD